MLKILSIATLCITLQALVGCSYTPPTTQPTSAGYPQVDALVSASTTAFNGKIYKTITEALAAAPANSKSPYVIAIAPGDYYEKITVTKPNITFAGSGASTTRLHYDAYSGQLRPKPRPKENKRWGTSGSATLTIQATGFTAHDLTIANSFDYPSNDQLAKGHPNKKPSPQAVAVLTDKGSDQALFERVRITGYQDTLYVKSGRSVFRQAFISGHVDFIFGDGSALFWQSEINTRARLNANGNSKPAPIGYITAPSTQISQPFGLVFIGCQLSREPGVNDNSMALGRPWHPTTTFADGRYADPNAIGQAVFIRSQMDQHIAGHAWHPMSGTAPNGNKIQFMPEDARFFEYQNQGPGALITENRRQLSDKQASHFTTDKVLNHWWPAATTRYHFLLELSDHE